MQGIWYQLGDDVHIGVGHIQHPAHIPDDAPGGHGAEGDDLGHVVVAVLAADVVHHLAPAGIAEIHVDIRHTHPLRVQEPLKVQAVLHGVNIRDTEAVADHGPRRAAAARSHRDTHAFGVAHEVGHDEEIVGKAHFLDHVLLVFQLAPVFVIIAVPGLVALVAQLFQIGKAVIPLRQLEFRQVVLTEGKFKVAHLRDLLGVFQCALVALEQRRHLCFAAEVEVLRLVAHPVFIVHRFAGLDAQQDVMGLGVLLPEVVGVVSTDHGDAGLLMDFQDGLVHQLLIPDAVILQFQIEPLRAEQLRHFQRIGLGAVIFPVPQATGNLAGQTRRQGNQPFGVRPQKFLIDAGLYIEALRPRKRHHVGEVAVALLVFAQQHQMAALAVEFVDLIEPGAALRGHIDLAADDGLHALRLASPIEVDDAVHNTVVRDGTGGLAHRLHHPRQLLDLAEAVQQAELSMHVQMGEGHRPPPVFFLK